MSKEKQIEEMAHIVSNSIMTWANEMPPISNPHFVATNLYNAGYRKQSEGEWIEQFDEYGENYIFTGFQCSKCEKEFFIPYEQERDDWLEMMQFCPNCGARMKGGGER